jgi:hypothetical protein
MKLKNPWNVDPSVQRIDILDTHMVFWSTSKRDTVRWLRSEYVVFYPFPGECWVESDEGWVAVAIKEIS